MSLTLTNVQLSNAGSYSFVATNLFGSVTSSPAILFVYTNTAQLAGQLTGPARSTNGQFQCNVIGVAGLAYAIQASTNLTKWTLLATNVSPYFFSDTNADAAPQRFYRSVYIP